MKPMLKFYVCVFLVIDICCISCTKEIPSASIINPSPPPLPPPPSPTANINFQFTPFDALSLARTHIKAATAKGKLVFAGGAYTEPYYDPYWGWGDVWIDVNNVDIYDTLTGAHTTAELSGYAMYKPGALGSKVYFPLGYSATGRMDIYDVTTNDWSTVMLSEARGGVTILSSGDKIFFAGGWGNSGPSSRIDIYNETTNSWSFAQLPGKWATETGAALGNKLFFVRQEEGIPTTSRIDIYDISTDTWSSANLSLSRAFLSVAVLGNKIFFAGGNYTNTGQGTKNSNRVDIYDNATQSWSHIDVNLTGMYTLNTNAISVNGKIFFHLDDGGRVIIYDGVTYSWSEKDLMYIHSGMALVVAGNIIYGAGGIYNKTFTNHVWKLEF